jgi:hypothetical protein
MMKKLSLLLLTLFIFLTGCDEEKCSPCPEQQQNVSAVLVSSLHNTTAGMEYFYATAQGGFEGLTGVPYDNLSCRNCHADPANCATCHEADQAGDMLPPENEACMACHGRQGLEMKKWTDVHRDAGMKCIDCHSAEEVHGDGTAYNSMLEGIIKVRCEDCHSDVLAEHDGLTNASQHLDAVDCSACHTQASTVCYNCHFDTEIAGQGKVAYKPGNPWKFLVKRDGKIHLGSIMTLVNGNDAMIAMAPFYSHTVYTPSNEICAECHENDLWKEYQANGTMNLVSWNAAGDSLDFVQNEVIFVPTDWETALRFDFVTKDSIGAPTWKHLVPDTVGHQMLFCEPLSIQDIPPQFGD